MIIEKSIKFRRLIPIIWKRIAVMTLMSSLIVVPIVVFDLRQLTIGMTTPLILGTAISIFLGFRTNSAYDRWFQGRAVFGQMSADTRNLALVLARINEPYRNQKMGKDSEIAAEVMPRMIRRGLAFLWAIGQELKGLDPWAHESVVDLIDPDELKSLRADKRKAAALLYAQSRDFRKAAHEGQFMDGEHFEIVAIQRSLASAINQAKRLNNTPFPTHYTYFTDLFVWLLVVLLSLSLPANENSGFYAIPLVVLIGWIFSMIEGIGDYMDYPWVNNRNVIPTDMLTRTLEREIRAIALGETTLPPRIEAVDGAIY